MDDIEFLRAVRFYLRYMPGPNVLKVFNEVERRLKESEEKNKPCTQWGPIDVPGFYVDDASKSHDNFLKSHAYRSTINE